MILLPGRNLGRLNREGKEMDKNTLIETLDQDTIVDIDNGESEPAAGLEISERLRASVAGVQVKKRTDRTRTTPRQKAFASLILQGHSPREAYEKAYEVKSDNAASHASSANKLLKNPRVSALVEGLWHSSRESIINDAIATRRHVMEQLMEHAEKAKQEGTKLKALELMGRAVGMFTDKVESKVEEVSTSQLKEELKSSLALLDNVKPFKQAKSR